MFYGIMRMFCNSLKIITFFSSVMKLLVQSLLVGDFKFVFKAGSLNRAGPKHKQTKQLLSAKNV